MRANSKDSLKSILKAASFGAMGTFGPSILTQFAVFSEGYRQAFLWAIIAAGIVNAIMLLVTWHVICGAGLTLTDIAARISQSLSIILSFGFCFCSVCFNISNMCGAFQGLQIIFENRTEIAIAIILLVLAGTTLTGAKNAVDRLMHIFGAIMVFVLIYMSIGSFERISAGVATNVTDCREENLFYPFMSILFGSFIPSIGGHKLLDEGVHGENNLLPVAVSASICAFASLLMRLLLFTADYGVVLSGATLDKNSPAAAVFLSYGGIMFYKLFGLVQLICSLSCVFSSTYSFKTFFSGIIPESRFSTKYAVLIMFIFCSAVVNFAGIPAQLMVFAGGLSSLLTPLTMLLVLVAGRSKLILNDEYRLSLTAQVCSVAVIIITSIGGLNAAEKIFLNLLC